MHVRPCIGLSIDVGVCMREGRRLSSLHEYLDPDLDLQYRYDMIYIDR